MDKVFKIFLATSLGTGASLAVIFQSITEILWSYLGWLAFGMYWLLWVFQWILSPLGMWMKGITDIIAASFESSPTEGANLIYLAIAIFIILVGVIVNLAKPKTSFVDELEAKYDHPPERVD